MNTTIAPTVHLPEELEVIFASLAERCKRRIDLEDIREWISAPGPSAEADDEAEWSVEDDLSEKPLYDVRKVLERKRLDRKTYYLVDWESTYERERRALVRKTYVEFEVVEGNTLNKTEG
ncbi:hypothetical protein ON010_g12052 [Phytophthora cinnamomi]|nr:hypothetical protein ON010_g12052 [Phytophthora cinnamomi]